MTTPGIYQTLCLDADGVPNCPHYDRQNPFSSQIESHMTHIRSRKNTSELNSLRSFIFPDGTLDEHLLRKKLAEDDKKCDWQCCVLIEREQKIDSPKNLLWTLGDDGPKNFLGDRLHSYHFRLAAQKLQVFPWDSVRAMIEEHPGQSNERFLTWNDQELSAPEF
jgi:hypothetical protein